MDFTRGCNMRPAAFAPSAAGGIDQGRPALCLLPCGPWITSMKAAAREQRCQREAAGPRRTCVDDRVACGFLRPCRSNATRAAFEPRARRGGSEFSPGMIRTPPDRLHNSCRRGRQGAGPWPSAPVMDPRQASLANRTLTMCETQQGRAKKLLAPSGGV